MALEKYQEKRDFNVTPEPKGHVDPRGSQRFVIQEHHATRLHFDLRLEMEGVLKSWAIPKGPSRNPKDKRLAVMTEDHPLEYIDYAGHIPDDSYGGGDMVVWDTGTYGLFEGDDPVKELGRGMLKLVLNGERLRGKFALIRMKGEDNQWLLIKEHDEYEDADWVLEPVLPWGSNKSKPAGAVVADYTKVDAGTPMPDRIDPMLAGVVDDPFSDPDWYFEIKWDGYRGVCFVDGGSARLVSRNQIDLSARYPYLAALPGKLNARRAIIDGEIVALDEAGRSQFQLFQTAMQTKEARSIVYYAFDLLYCDGVDLRDRPLSERKQKLKTLLRPDGTLRYSDHVVGEGKALFEHAKTMGLEGLMAKKADSVYEARRSKQWLKIKIIRQTDVVIGGYTEPKGTRKHIGALVAGVYDGDKLIPVGHVSIGSSTDRIEEIYHRLKDMEVDKSPFDVKPRLNEAVHWVRPELVAEVKYGEWTGDRQLRTPILIDFRFDKEPRDCVFELPADTKVSVEEAEAEPVKGLIEPETEAEDVLAAGGPVKGTVVLDGHEVPVTNLDKVYWPDDGFTKRDLLRYYRDIAPSILPHLANRPLILRRYPNGVDKQHFFQHDVKGTPGFVDIYERDEDGKTLHYVICHNAATLLYLANLGAISVDAWLAPVKVGREPEEKDIRPDQVVFDLDPDDVPAEGIAEVALSIRDELARVGLIGYPKTSGGSGIHIYVPIEPIYDFPTALALANYIADKVETAKPKLVTTARRIKDRGHNKVYLDCYQNSEGKSVAAAYCVRARQGATVSAPVSWAEVEKTVRIEDFSIVNMPERVSKLGDLFAPVLTNRQRIGSK